MHRELRRLLLADQTNKGFACLDVMIDKQPCRLFVEHVFSNKQYATIKFKIMASSTKVLRLNELVYIVDGTPTLLVQRDDLLQQTNCIIHDFFWLDGAAVDLFTYNAQSRELRPNYYFAENFFKYLMGRLGLHGIRYQDGSYIVPENIPTILFEMAEMISS